MRVLVTGGAGYIGSHVALSALEAAHEVAVLDNLSRGNTDAVQRVETLTGQTLPLFQGDLRDRPFVRATLREGFDGVIHCAAYKSVSESVAHPDWYEANNVEATSVLAQELEHAGVRRVVYASTGGAYGEGTGAPFREDDPLRPINPYGDTKARGEPLMAAVPGGGVALRFFNVCGAHPSGQLGEYPGELVTNLMPVLVKQLHDEHMEISVFGTDWPTPDGTPIRDYVHVVDIAEGCLAALERGTLREGFRPYNLGTGSGSSVLEVIRAVESAMGREFKVVAAPRREGDPARVVADVTRIRDELGWTSRFDLAEMAESAVSWAREILAS